MPNSTGHMFRLTGWYTDRVEEDTEPYCDLLFPFVESATNCITLVAGGIVVALPVDMFCR